MADYVYNGSTVLTFPTLFDANGNVLVVNPGDTFTGPDGLTNDGVAIAVAKLGKAKVDAPAETPAPTDAPTDAPATTNEGSN